MLRHLIPAMILSCALLPPPLAAEEAEAVAGSATGTLIMTLQGSFPLRSPGSLFMDQDRTLHDATMELREAVQAPERRLVLDLSSGFAPGLAAAEELAAVLRARPADKRVACLIDGIEDAGMVVAAACDEVVVAEAGVLAVDGIAGGMSYYADALAKLGIRFHAVTSGPAKTAPEPFTRSTPSEAAKTELEHQVRALDRVLMAACQRPGVNEALLTTARAQAPQTAQVAVSVRLADKAVEPGAWLRSQPGPVRHQKRKDKGRDIDSLASLMTVIGELFNGQAETKHPKAVAVVELEGDILDGDGGVPGYAITGHDTAKLFDRLADDQRIVAVVVRVNSPGGSAGASDRIHFAIRRCVARKPVVALFDGVSASGGYYLGCAAQEIHVHRGTITGSIGVFGMMPDLAGTRQLLGINRHQFVTGPRAGMYDLDGFGPEKEAGLRQVIEAVDKRFQGLVAERRKLDAAKVHELAGGRVFTGEEAVKLGLADRIGDLPGAVARARELARQPEPLPLERYPKPSGLAAKLGLSSTLAAQVGLPPELVRMITLARLGRPLVMCWAPVVEAR